MAVALVYDNCLVDSEDTVKAADATRLDPPRRKRAEHLTLANAGLG